MAQGPLRGAHVGRWGVVVSLWLGLCLAPAAWAMSPYGTRLTFHGWSPDGKRVAYTRHRTLAPKKPGWPTNVIVKKMHRRVKRCEFTVGAPRPKHSDGEFADWVRHLGYTAENRQAVRVDDRTYRIEAPEGVYMLDIKVGDRMAWELSFEGEVLTKQRFLGLFVDFKVSLHPSPDRRCAMLVMHLDKGWLVDAAIYPVALPKTLQDRWKLLTSPTPSVSPPAVP